MIYIISKKTNEVKMVTSGKINYDKSLFYEKEINDNDYTGYEMKYINEKLVKTKIVDFNDKKKELKEKIENATKISDIKDIIKELI